MRIYLCDESAKERSAIKKCVDKYLRGNYQVSIKEFSSVENMLSELPVNKPSLMIVNLPEQKIKDPVIVQKLQGRKSNQKMIMTAASECYAMDAFSVYADGFLIKPFVQQQVDCALNRFRNMFYQMKKNISLLSEANKSNAADLISYIKNPWKRINIAKYLEENPLDSKYNKEIEKILSDDTGLYALTLQSNSKIVEILKDFYKVTVEMLNRKVPIESFAKCLYQVRRIEAYKNPAVYSFDIDELIEIVDDYYMSENELEPSLNEQQSQLSRQLMLKRKSMEQTVIESIQELECISKISDNNKIEKDIKRI